MTGAAVFGSRSRGRSVFRAIPRIMSVSRKLLLALVLIASSCRGRTRHDAGSGPLSPEEALRTFRLPDGLHIELVAAEPDVQEPVAMAIDEDGRIYVADMLDYPLGSPSGRIMR